MKNRETFQIGIAKTQLYYEYSESGSEPTLIFIHGAFADSDMFNPQWDYFLGKKPILRFDSRGHGKSGSTKLQSYTMEIFVNDLADLMNTLKIPSAVICGVSWGGSIAQGFATKYPEKVKGLVLAGSMVSMSLTFWEKIQQYVLVPNWLMQFMIRTLSVRNFIKFTFLLSDIFFGKEFLSRVGHVSEYMKGTMLKIDSQEYRKIWGAIYAFDGFPIEKISCPTLLLNGEFESKKVKRHTQELLKRIPNTSYKVIPEAKHAINMENPEIFNQIVEGFIRKFNQ